MKLLFVCTGNTCRSCMAEAVFNHLNTNTKVEAYSAGVSIIKDSKTSYNTSSILMDNFNIDISSREAVQLNKEMIKEFDLILTMTKSIKLLLIGLLPDESFKIHTLNEYIEVNGEVSDPFGGNLEIYNKTFTQLKNNILLLIAKIKEDNCIIE